MKLLATSRQPLPYLLTRTISTSFMVLCLVASLVPSNFVLAISDKIYLSQSSSQMSIDTTFCLDVIGYASADANPGTAIGTLNYDSGRLQLVQIEQNGKKCPDAQGNTTATSYYQTQSIVPQSGSIAFNTSQSQADGGIRYIFSLKFKAKAAGTAQISFSSGSNGTKLNGAQPTLIGGSYVINAPAPAPSPSAQPSSSPKPSPIVSTPPQVQTPSNTVVVPETKNDPTGLIDSVIASPSYTTATITWKVNAPNPSSTITYGTSFDKLDKTAKPTLTADGSFTTTISNLSPGVYYYFSMTASGTGVSPGNYSSSFVTNGYPVSIQITENNVAVKNAQVKIGQQSLTANNGSLTIGLAAGNYTGTITTDTATLNINLTVKDVGIPSNGSAPETQKFGPYNLSSAPLSGGPGSNFSLFTFIGVLAGGTIIFVFAFLLIISYRRRKFESNSYSTSPTTTVIVEDGYDWHQNTDEPSPHTGDQTPATRGTVESPISADKNTASNETTYDEPLDIFEKAGIPAPKPHDIPNQK